jgi:hypothetical protein
MKKFILVLTLLCGTAHADKWLEMPNNAGGKILLLSSECKTGRGHMVIATTPQGDSINGCWYYFADMVHVVWDGGKTSSFNPTDFTYKESK